MYNYKTEKVKKIRGDFSRVGSKFFPESFIPLDPLINQVLAHSVRWRGQPELPRAESMPSRQES